MSAKALLVTGASRGIGRAFALLAAQNGRSVALKGDIALEAGVLGMFDAATEAPGPRFPSISLRHHGRLATL